MHWHDYGPRDERHWLGAEEGVSKDTGVGAVPQAPRSLTRHQREGGIRA